MGLGVKKHVLESRQVKVDRAKAPAPAHIHAFENDLSDVLKKKEIERFPDLRWEGHQQLSCASQLTTGHQVASSFQLDGFLGALANDF